MTEDDNMPVTVRRDQETMGERIVRLRTAAGIDSAAELARRIYGTTTDKRGYSVAKNRDTIWRYETNKAMPSRKNIERMAVVLGVTVAELDPSRASPGVPVAKQLPMKMEMLSNGTDARISVTSAEIPNELAMQLYKAVADWWARSENAPEPMPNPLKRK